MVLNNPFDRENEPLNHDIFERFFGSIDILKSRKEFVNSIQNEIRDNIDHYIKQNNPDLLINFNIIYQEISRMVKDFEKTINSIERKTKKLFESSSLTEDVYKMRDEMKSIKKKIDRLNSGLKKFSTLGASLDEE